MPEAPNRTLATFADLALLGDDARAEIIAGAIVEKAPVTMEHGHAHCALAGFLGRRFDRKPGRVWPGGWRFAMSVEVEHGVHDVYRHDVAGWRRQGTRPSGWPVRVRPDWVCELLSPESEKHDLVDKMRTLHACGVPHYWILNPEEKILVVHRHSTDGYVVVLTATSGETVHAEPFGDVELRVGVLFDDEDEDE